MVWALENFRNKLSEAPLLFFIYRNPEHSWRNPYLTDATTKHGEEVWKDGEGSTSHGVDNKCLGPEVAYGLQQIDEKDLSERRYINVKTKSRIDLLLDKDINTWLSLPDLRWERLKSKAQRSEYRQILNEWRLLVEPITTYLRGEWLKDGKSVLKEWFEMRCEGDKYGGNNCKFDITVWEPKYLKIDDFLDDDKVCFEGTFRVRISYRHEDCNWAYDKANNFQEYKHQHQVYQTQIDEGMNVLLSFNMGSEFIDCKLHIEPVSGVINMKTDSIMNPIQIKFFSRPHPKKLIGEKVV